MNGGRMNGGRTFPISELGSVSRRWAEQNVVAARMAMLDVAYQAENLYIDRARHADAVDTGRLINSFRVDPIPTGATLSNDAPHFLPIDQGRSPGEAPPPIEPILEWVKRKQLVGKGRAAVNKNGDLGNAALRVAYAVRRKIARDGIEPRRIASGREAVTMVMLLLRRTVAEYIEREGGLR